MGMQSPQDWERYLNADLVPYIFPAGQSGCVRRPARADGMASTATTT